MEKRSTFGVMQCIMALAVAFLLIHVTARAIWVWDPINAIVAASFDTTVECLNLYNEPCYATVTYTSNHTFDYHGASAMEVFTTHVWAVIFLVIVGACLAAIGWAAYKVYRWVVYRGAKEIYVTVCDNPDCQCAEHTVRGARFDSEKKQWVSDLDALVYRIANATTRT